MLSRDEVKSAIASGTPVSLNGADLVGADLRRLTLAGADLSYADLEGACLDRADLRGARLWSVRARSASLVGCDLRKADLQTADLTGADLRGARLVGALLTGTTLTGALLDGAELSPEQLAGAVIGAPSYAALGERDDGATVQLAIGGILEVALPEGTTGYRWQLSGVVAPMLSSADPRRDPAATPAAGAFGQRVFRFTAAAPGSAEVRLRLVQPWDADAPAAKTYSAHVRVG